MASTKISDETTASSLTGTEIVPVVQGGSNRKTTTQDIADLSGFAHTSVTGNVTLPSGNAIVSVDTTAVSAPGLLTLTLPTPEAGRLYIIRKVDGSANEGISLARAASELIDNASASRVLPGSQLAVSGGVPPRAWWVYSDGTDWYTTSADGLTRWHSAAAAPSNTSDTWIQWESSTPSGGEWVPGSFWYDSSAGTPGHLYLSMGLTLGTNRWARVDAVEVSSLTASATLPERDQSVFVDTGSGAVTLTLPDPTGNGEGRQFSITKTNTGTNKITLARNASENINGSAANLDLPGSDDADYGRWHVVSDGTDWWVTGGSGLT